MQQCLGEVHSVLECRVKTALSHVPRHMYLHNINQENDNSQLTRSILRAQTSLAEANHYSHVALILIISVDQPGL